MKQVIMESTLQVMFQHNPDVVQQIINNFKKKEVNGVVYYVSK